MMVVCIFKDATRARSGLQRCLIKVRYYRPIAQSSLRLKVYENGFDARGAIIRKWLVTAKRHHSFTAGTLIYATFKSRVEFLREIDHDDPLYRAFHTEFIMQFSMHCKNFFRQSSFLVFLQTH